MGLDRITYLVLFTEIFFLFHIYGPNFTRKPILFVLTIRGWRKITRFSEIFGVYFGALLLASFVDETGLSRHFLNIHTFHVKNCNAKNFFMFKLGTCLCVMQTCCFRLNMLKIHFYCPICKSYKNSQLPRSLYVKTRLFFAKQC